MDLSQVTKRHVLYYSYELDRIPTEADTRCGVVMAESQGPARFVVGYVTPHSLRSGEWTQGYYRAGFHEAMEKFWSLVSHYEPSPRYADIVSHTAIPEE